MATSVYQAANPQVKATLAQTGTLKSFRDGEVLYGAGSDGAVWLVVDGIVRRVMPDATQDYLGPGQWLGFYPTLTEGQHGSVVTAETSVEALSIPPERFRECVRRDPDFEHHIWKLCGQAWFARMMRREKPYKDWSPFKRARWASQGHMINAIGPQNPHVSQVQLSRVRLKMAPGHTYVLLCGTSTTVQKRKSRRRASSVHSPQLSPGRAGSPYDWQPGSPSCPSSSSCVELETLVGGQDPSTAVGTFRAPCLLPADLKVVELSQNGKVFCAPPSDGLWNLGELSHKLEVNVANLHHATEMDPSFEPRSREGTMASVASDTPLDSILSVRKPKRTAFSDGSFLSLGKRMMGDKRKGAANVPNAKTPAMEFDAGIISTDSDVDEPLSSDSGCAEPDQAVPDHHLTDTHHQPTCISPKLQPCSLMLPVPSPCTSSRSHEGDTVI